MSDKKKNAIRSIEDSPFWQDREISWLSYASRILDQASDETVPLLERLWFMSIFQSDMHQFFQQRVGSIESEIHTLKQLKHEKKHKKGKLDDLIKTSQSIYEKAGSFSERANTIYSKTTSLLSNWGVDHIHGRRLTHTMLEYQRIFLEEFVRNNILKYLSPYIVDDETPFPYLEDGTIYVVAHLRSRKSKKGDSKLGLLPLPARADRIIKLPSEKASTRIASNQATPLADGADRFAFVLIEDALELMAEEIFTNYDVLDTDSIVLYRNSNLERFERIDSEDPDYLEEIDSEVNDDAGEEPVLLLARHGFDGPAAKLLRKGVHLSDYQIQTSGMPLDLSYQKEIQQHLSDAAKARITWAPYKPKWTRTGPLRLNPNRSILDQIAAHDALFIYPYESMAPFLDMLEEASEDPSVSAIEMTIYRLAKESKVATYLMDAARNGKKVTAVVELRASYDEGQNAKWAEKFKEAGINVLFGLEDYKVHGKICCITRTVGGAVQRIVQIGTGNYDEVTAAEYTDFSFMTSDDQFGRDATALFYNIAKGRTSSEYRDLCIAPTQIKRMLLRKIDEQIQYHREGYAAGVFFKVNAVTDHDIIQKLVEASQAGVPVVMIVRDSTCILPGIEGYTDNVRIASLVGRLLEHGRIYGFGPWDDMDIYLSSADLMSRNLDKRIEIAWPIYDSTLRKRIIQYANLCLNDTAKLRELLPDGQYTPLGALAKETDDGRTDLFDSQEYLLHKG